MIIREITVPPTSWLENPGASHQLINRSNYLEWLKSR